MKEENEKAFTLRISEVLHSEILKRKSGSEYSHLSKSDYIVLLLKRCLKEEGQNKANSVDGGTAKNVAS